MEFALRALRFLWSNLVPVVGVVALLALLWKVYSQHASLKKQQLSVKEVKKDMSSLVQMISRMPRRPAVKATKTAAAATHDTLATRAYHNQSAPINHGPSSALPSRQPPVPGKDPNTDDETNAALSQWFASGGITRSR